MTDKPLDEAKSGRISDRNRELLIQVLCLEYQQLSEQTLARTTGRFQFLGLMTTAAALLTTGAFGSSAFKGRNWIAVALAALVFAFGAMCFIYIGRQREDVLRRLWALRERINALVPAEDGFTVALGSTKVRIHWTLYDKIKFFLFGTLPT